MIGSRIIHRDLNIPGVIVALRANGRAVVKYDSITFERVELISKLKEEGKDK